MVHVATRDIHLSHGTWHTFVTWRHLCATRYRSWPSPWYLSVIFNRSPWWAFNQETVTRSSMKFVIVILTRNRYCLYFLWNEIISKLLYYYYYLVMIINCICILKKFLNEDHLLYRLLIMILFLWIPIVLLLFIMLYYNLLFVLYCLVIRLWMLMYFWIIFKIKNIDV